MPRISILDIPFDAIKSNDVLHCIDTFVTDRKQHIIVTPNPEMILEALEDSKLKEVLQQASLSLPDGTGILWASKFFSLPKTSFLGMLWQWKKTLLSLLFYPPYCKTVLPERVTGSDSMKNICSHAQQEGYSLFLLGAKQGVAAMTQKALEKIYPRIKIVGTYAGNPFTEDDTVILEKINATKPHILFVAFGSPKQELWIAKNISNMPSVKVAMGIGGSFDFIAGTIKRAPVFFQRSRPRMALETLPRTTKKIPEDLECGSGVSF